MYAAGHELYQKGQYYDAGKKFESAEFEADSAVVKANALQAQTSAWRMAKLYSREFDTIEKLLKHYPEYADFAVLVKREFEIGDEFYHGHRDPAFWAFRWVPWLTGDDRSIEILTAAVGHAPFAAEVPRTRLQLSWLYDNAGNVKASLAELRRLISDFPDAPEIKFAYLALGEGLFMLSKTGDGDGKYNREAQDVFRKFEEKYPEAKENAWISRHRLQARDIQAARLYEMAEYYERNGRREASQRYLAKILKEYPDSLSADRSEAMLANLDSTFIPEDFRPEAAPRLEHAPTYPYPVEAERILITPNSRENKKYLLPVTDLFPPPTIPEETVVVPGGKEEAKTP